MGYKKDLFISFAYDFELLHKYQNHLQADTVTSSLLLLTYYFKIDKVILVKSKEVRGNK